mmetsp:Transcript_1438/g.3460  ORF Transcript_1438/g.3460 Transcript_1438/m.3460 type:complete len:236 (-) Transcript_1438:95-802(-)
MRLEYKLGGCGLGTGVWVTGEEFASVLFDTCVVPLSLKLMVNRHCLDLKPHDQGAGLLDLLHARALGLDVVVPDCEAEVVVDVEVGGVLVRRLREGIPEPVRDKLMTCLVPVHYQLRARQIVQPHVCAEVGRCKVAIFVDLAGRPGAAASGLTEAGDVCVELVGRSFGPLPRQHLAQVFRERSFAVFRLAKRNVVVIKLKRGEVGGEGVGLDHQLLSLHILARSHSGQVKGVCGG